MPDIKTLLALRVTACKKFIEGGDEDLTKRLMRLEQRRGQGFANTLKMLQTTKKAAKPRSE